ncbi:gene transfer agent family protein [Ruegeria jejuensis]|uniref:gene transfer agent family protein n=1 Tax=Ruegeria jejuensis TaxID=3233338 RepID=UPI00355B7875
MVEVVTEWAGKERLFCLDFGRVLDLEEACGDAIGSIFVRVASGRYKVSDVYHTMRLGLVGGGMSVIDAKRIMVAHFDTRPYAENAVIAGEILASLMVGVEPSDEQTSEAEAIKFSEVSQICREFNMSPEDLRRMRYSDFVNLVRGFNAASSRQADHISEEEFVDILNRYEPEAG